MLRKLLKYELRATSRYLIPLYIAIIILSVLNRFINPIMVIESVEGFQLQGAITLISTFLYVGLVIAIAVATFIIMIQRFYKNLLGDEGYLMFTLPVRPWQHILSKLITSLIWMLISLIIIISSIIISVDYANPFKGIAEFFAMVRDNTGGYSIFFTLPLSALVLSSSYILAIYNAMAIGHLYSRHRVIASFGAYIGIYIVSQIILTTSVFSYAYKVFGPAFENNAFPPTLVEGFMGFIAAISLVLAVANFFIANFILTKKLNLD